ncbi:class A beta-lactamase [Kineococcus sp. DHX-1]|uniref:class A beta-lactamase n=1 Tax=Kineococcus sp. DHX-1 TaxID=3349638 RepID=UPI0036D33B69
MTVRRTTTLLSAPLSAPLSALVLLAGCSDPAPPASAPSTRPSAASNTVSPPRFDALEQEFGARLGVFAVDTGSGRTVEHRADERFAFASTYKALAAAAVLDSGADLATRIPVTDLVDHSPVTGEHVGGTMSLGEVAEAAVTVSDNTAGNLLFDQLGGPTGFEADLRALGDTVTESARTEPGLNRWNPGEVDDTSSPRAFAADLRAYAVGETLDAADRDVFTGWLRGNTTGSEQIRAGVPTGWVVGDKTGHAGRYGNQNDVGVVWPSGGRAPWVVVVFSDRPGLDDESDPALVARAAGLVVDALS